MRRPSNSGHVPAGALSGAGRGKQVDVFRSGAPSLRTLSNFLAVARVMLAIAIAGAASAQSGSRDGDQSGQPSDGDCGGDCDCGCDCGCHDHDSCGDDEEEPAAEEEKRPVWRFPKQWRPRDDH